MVAVKAFLSAGAKSEVVCIPLRGVEPRTVSTTHSIISKRCFALTKIKDLWLVRVATLNASLVSKHEQVGTTADGGAPAGTGVAFVRGAARAGVVRPGGTGGDGQANPQEYVRRGPVGREFVRRRQVGQDSNVRNRSLLRGDDLDGPRVTGRRRAGTGTCRNP